MSPDQPPPAVSVERIRQILVALGLSPDLLAQRRRPPHLECTDLVPVGLDAFGRELQLERRTAQEWLALQAAAQADGVVLLPISGYRSLEYQRGIIARKLAAGQKPEEIFRVSALPGYSEHHTGRAIDLGTPGCTHLSESFADSSAFLWLEANAGRFGFTLSYPRGNPHGIAFEPWHWCRQETSPSA